MPWPVHVRRAARDVLKVAGGTVAVEVEQVCSRTPACSKRRWSASTTRDEVPVEFVVAADPTHRPVDELTRGGGGLTKSSDRGDHFVDEFRVPESQNPQVLLRDPADSSAKEPPPPPPGGLH